jgi:uncharacterized protein YndB with AHSA1/START domain
MAVIRRTRIVAATPDEVWETAADPHHLPRWWPKVQRVEGVDAGGFTQVMRTEKGRAIRADFRIDEARRPELSRWSQELEGTPFERLFAESSTELRLAPDPGGGTRVTLVAVRRMRGLNRLGGPLLRRATRRQLDEALDGLAALHGAS